MIVVSCYVRTVRLAQLLLSWFKVNIETGSVSFLKLLVEACELVRVGWQVGGRTGGRFFIDCRLQMSR